MHYGTELEQEDFTPRKEQLVGQQTEGQLQIQNLSMRYRPDLPIVLQGVDVNIAAGEKVGVIGRTGSGKSSIIMWYVILYWDILS